MIKIKTTCICDNCGTEIYRTLEDAIYFGWMQVAEMDQPETFEFCSDECRMKKTNGYGAILKYKGQK